VLHLALSPFAPHIADELWEAYGFEGFTLQQPFPQYDESLARADEFEMVVQVNGKLRDRIVVPADISREAMERLALGKPARAGAPAGQIATQGDCRARQVGEYRGVIPPVLGIYGKRTDAPERVEFSLHEEYLPTAS
jgi:leucyl-tRNA synthetase